MKTLKTIAIKTLKPRNPLVAASHFRRAGAHRSAADSTRQQAGRSLQREMDRLRTHSP